MIGAEYTHESFRRNSAFKQFEEVTNLEPTAPFPVDIFPTPLRRFIQEGAEAFPCPPDFLAIPMLTVLGTAIGTSRVLEVKPNWEEGPRIYSAVVAPSGAKKSPALALAAKPLQKRQEAIQLGNSQSNVLAALNSPGPIATPAATQVFTTDTTTEALVEVLEDNPRGIAVVHDELAGWVTSMNQYKDGGGSDRQIWLSFWGGASVVVNRKKTGRPVTLPRPLVNVTGCLPPDILGTFSDEHGHEDGFIQRILFGYPEDIQLQWTEASVSHQTMDGYLRLCQKLWELQPNTDANGNPIPKILKWTTEGKREWVEVVTTHYRELNDPSFPTRLRGTWAKMEGYCARFALIIHLCRLAAGEVLSESVDEVSVKAANRLADYFKNHARKVFGRLSTTEEDKQIQDAFRWIHQRGGSATARDVYTSKVAGCKKAADAETLFKKMRDLALGTIELEHSEHGGPETRRFRLTIKDQQTTEDVSPSLPQPRSSSEGAIADQCRPSAEASEPGQVQPNDEPTGDLTRLPSADEGTTV